MLRQWLTYATTAFFVLHDDFLFRFKLNLFFMFIHRLFFLVDLPIICLLKIPLLCMGKTIQRLRTRSTAVRHWRDLSLSAYEQDLVTNETL